jgi:hypothetical protein
MFLDQGAWGRLVCSLASSLLLDSHHAIDANGSASRIKLHRMSWPCHAAYSNRAACHIQLGAFAAAIEDADRCIALEPACSKVRRCRLTPGYPRVTPGWPQVDPRLTPG